MAEIEIPNSEELAELREKSFTRRVALVTAFYAVLLAITSLGGSNAMKEMLLAQQQASDQWSFYQAKAIREHLYRVERMRVESDLALLNDKFSEDARSRLAALAKSLSDEEKRFGSEKVVIEKEAKRLEDERDVNRTKDPYFDYAEVLLQIAIVMASVSILSTSRSVFFFSLAAALIGALLSVNGFLLLVKLPILQ